MWRAILEPVRRWVFILHEDLERLRHEMEGLRGDIRELSAQLARLSDEVKQLRESAGAESEEQPPRWKM
jgi:outer membrane murein-binding lipoprotein Lpp